MKVMMNVDRPVPDTINMALRANLKNVTRWSTAVTVYNGTEGGAVVVQHDLGVTPTDLDVESWQDCRFWADVGDRRVWSATNVTFHASHKGSFTVRAGYQ